MSDIKQEFKKVSWRLYETLLLNRDLQDQNEKALQNMKDIHEENERLRMENSDLRKKTGKQPIYFANNLWKQ